MEPLPRRSEKIFGCGGQIRVEVEDFEVEEVPLYLPSGTGEHLYLWLEKRDTSASMLRRLIASSLGISPRDIGMAGMKDRRAVTRQWISVPRVAAARVEQIDGPRVRVIDAKYHQNKLRTGHLRGNRFRIVVRGTVAEAVQRAQNKLTLLAELGMPNFYGPQRMGRGGSTLATGWALSQGVKRKARVELPDGSIHQVNLRDRHLTRLAASALQSELFNRVVAARLKRGDINRVLPGDLCRRRATGGTFVTDDVAREQERIDAGELVLTGPMWGPKMPRPKDDVAELELHELTELGLTDEAFGRIGHLAAGARRSMLVWPSDVSVSALSDTEQSAITVCFSLPSGSFASVLIHELVGPLDEQDTPFIAEPTVATGTHLGLAGDTPCA